MNPLALLAVAFSISAPSPSYGRWVDQTHIKVPAVNVTVLERPCPTIVEPTSCVIADQPNVIYMHRRSRQTFFHELGHVYDSYNGSQRVWFRRIMGYKRSWSTTSRNADGTVAFPGVEELFADAYSECSFTLSYPDMYFGTSGYGYNPSAKQAKAVCNRLRVR